MPALITVKYGSAESQHRWLYALVYALHGTCAVSCPLASHLHPNSFWSFPRFHLFSTSISKKCAQCSRSVTSTALTSSIPSVSTLYSSSSPALGSHTSIFGEWVIAQFLWNIWSKKSATLVESLILERFPIACMCSTVELGRLLHLDVTWNNRFSSFQCSLCSPM
jgi:hypothetical protein